MRPLLFVLLFVTNAHAEPATVTITNSALWPSHPKPVSVRIGGGAWTKVATDKTVGPVSIKVPAGGKAIAFDVQSPTGRKSFRRWAAVLPGVTYKLVGNPCGTWGLDIDAKRDPDDESSDVARMEVDATGVSPKLFPLVISTDHSEEGEPEPEAVLEKPGISALVDLSVSAMCSRSGTSIVVYSRATKKRLLAETLIAHPGATHTITVRPFTVTVAR